MLPCLIQVAVICWPTSGLLAVVSGSNHTRWFVESISHTPPLPGCLAKILAVIVSSSRFRCELDCVNNNPKTHTTRIDPSSVLFSGLGFGLVLITSFISNLLWYY